MNATLDDTRRNLLARRAQLILRLERIRADAAHRRQPLAADSDDRAQETENDEVLERLDNATAASLRQFDHALDRLDRGHYGVCETCGFAIEPARLAAVPEATLCASCAAASSGAAPRPGVSA